MVPFCILGSAYWAAFVVAAFLPLYALLLIWYARRFGGTEVTRRFVVLASLILGVPGALWVAYANAFPVYELQRSVRLGSSYGALALLSFWVALVSPRLLVGRLGPGQLRRLVGA
jgi:hypothetical protein